MRLPETALDLVTAGLRRLPPETAHELAIRALQVAPPQPLPETPSLATELCGMKLAHPIGLAAGFDKDARAVDGLLRTGFAFVEPGTVTLRPQAGNPQPRLFRLEEDRALINRMGFNNAGIDAFCARLAARGKSGGPVGANIGINKDTTTPLQDYAACFSRVLPLADYVTINVSSPNTPGLRDLQEPETLARLLAALRPVRETAERRPLLLKIAPDLDADMARRIADTAHAAGIDGLIVSNTTLARPASLRSGHKDEAGGLSGAPLMGPSTELLALLARHLGGAMDLVGTGGIMGPEDVRAKLDAGARAVQVYTGYVLMGPAILPRWLRALAGSAG